MLDLIKACYELRALEGRRGLGIELGAPDLQALASLERLFYGRRALCEGRRTDWWSKRARRIPARVAVLLRSPQEPGRVTDGVMADLSASGFFVETATRLEAGAELTVLVRDPNSGWEWHFPARVARASASGLGLELCGIPIECRHWGQALAGLGAEEADAA